MIATGKTPEVGLGSADRTRSVLEYIHRLLVGTREDFLTLAELLGELAQAFGAAGAGLAAPLDGPSQIVHAVGSQPKVRPWEKSPDWLARLGTAAVALPWHDAGASGLGTVVRAPDQVDCLLWLNDGPQRTWSDGEIAALPLAGQALARLITFHPPWARTLERLDQKRQVESAAALTGRLAHDFGNVLTGILGFTELSLAQLPADSLPGRYLREVWQSAQQGAQWVNQLQLFSRRTPPPFWPAHLPPIVQEETSRLRAAWGGDIALLAALAEDLPPLAMDAESLKQLLRPLFDNAREAIAGKGVVTISARTTDLTAADCLDLLGSARPGRFVEITITDTGQGLSPQVRRRLFRDLFVSSKPRHRGLGLAVVYGLVQAFGGGLRFGPDPAQGTAVCLFLPLAGPGGERPVLTGRLTPAARLPEPAAHILVVDDDRMILESVCTVLENAGHRVKAAPGPAEAIACYIAAREPFHLVLSDVAMPGMTGFDMIRRLRAHDAAVNALFISSLDAVQPLPQDDLLGQFGLLPKPFEPEMLLKAVQAALAGNPHGPPLARGG